MVYLVSAKNLKQRGGIQNCSYFAAPSPNGQLIIACGKLYLFSTILVITVCFIFALD